MFSNQFTLINSREPLSRKALYEYNNSYTRRNTNLRLTLYNLKITHFYFNFHRTIFFFLFFVTQVFSLFYVAITDQNYKVFLF